MNRQATHLVRTLLFCFILVGCDNSGDTVDKRVRLFYTQQEAFESLAKTACAARDELNIRFFHYPRGIQTLQPLAQNTAKPYFNEIKKQLRTLKRKTLLIQSFPDKNIECSLYVDVDSVNFAGDGFYYGYSYQPESLGTYEYTKDFFSDESIAERDRNWVRGTEAKFSIELDKGWYLQYSRYR